MHSQFTFGENSSDEYGVIAVYFENNTNRGLYAGQMTNLITDKAAHAIEWEIISQDYNKPMEFTLQLVNENGSNITPEEERALCRWLCQRGKYQWLYIQDERYSDIWIRCVIHSPQIWVVSNLVGMQFTVTTSSSVAFSEEYEYIYKITDDNKLIKNLYIYNDEELPIYPSIELTMQESGNLEIRNDADTSDYFTKINNVIAGEIIKLESDTIESSSIAHNIIDDYNLKPLRLYNENNNLQVNLKCSVIIKYREYRKLVVY
ncbi:MAG: hypothetical protein LUH21_03820 [Clostridiales bacterium]|nr:hypothetical protein [Clostridiales bacterium]